MRKGIALLMLLCSLAWAQNPPAAPTIQTSRLGFPVYGLNAVPIQGATLQVVGTAGRGLWYIWGVANYQEGSVMSLLGVVTNAPDVLSGSNYVAIYPFYPSASGVTVDILATQTALQPSGACNCAIATGQSSAVVLFQSSSLNSYTVSLVNPNSFRLWLTNEVTGSGASHLLLRNEAGTLITDLSAVGSGSIGGSGTNGKIAMFTAGATIGNSDLTDSIGNNIATGTLVGVSALQVVSGSTAGCTASVGTFPIVNTNQGCQGVFSNMQTGAGPTGTTIAGLFSNVNAGSAISLGIGVAGITSPAQNEANSIGVYGECVPAITVTMTSCRGVYGFAFNDGITTLANNEGGVFVTWVAGGVTNTNNYGVHVLAPTFNGGGTLTHNYGILVEDQTAGGGGNPDAHGIVVVAGGMQNRAVAFATLPACASAFEGTINAVSDSNTAVWGATIANGGTNHVLAYCDGTNWTVAGK